MSEHSNPTNRRLHFLGKVAVLMALVTFLLTRSWVALVAIPILGYGFSWVGHLFFERNKPAAFGNPFYSVMGDLLMMRDMLRGRIEF
jgi:hypothetical protein